MHLKKGQFGHVNKIMVNELENGMRFFLRQHIFNLEKSLFFLLTFPYAFIKNNTKNKVNDLPFLNVLL